MTDYEDVMDKLVFWMTRNEDGERVEIDNDYTANLLSIYDFAGPGEEHKDCEGVWYEVYDLTRHCWIGRDD